MYKDMYNILKEGKSGDYRLDKFEVKKDNLRALFQGIPIGKYIRLSSIYGECIMSNTPMEKRTNREVINKANGDVLIAGLGLGLILLPIQEKENVKSITVVEKSNDIIKLVGNQLDLNNKVKIINDDIFTYESKLSNNTKFDTIYFDIWNEINKTIYEEQMLYLKEIYNKYKRFNNSYIKCWAEYEASHEYNLV